MILEIIDCDTITVSDPLITQWKAENPANTFTLKVIVTDPEGNETSTDITSTNVPSPAPYLFSIDAVQGVYTITLEQNLNEVISRETQCLFNECDLACELAERLAEPCPITHRLLSFLRAINLCNSCECETARRAYHLLIKKLNRVTVNITTNDCGCN